MVAVFPPPPLDADAPMLTASDYQPPRWLRNPHLQSMLSSSRMRLQRGLLLLAATGAVSEELILDGGEGVRLQGWHSHVEGREPRGIALLLQRKRQPAVGLGLAGFVTGPRLGQLHGLAGIVLAQRLEDLVLHGRPVQGQTRIVAGRAPVPVQPGRTRRRRCATQRSENPSPRQFSRKPQWPPQQAVSSRACCGSCQSRKVA